MSDESSTPDRILDALVSIVTDGRVFDFSVQEIADRAGVSHRTVYRHFTDRQGLLDGLGQRLDDQLVAAGAPARVRSMAQLPVDAEMSFDLWDEIGDAMHAFAVLSAAAPRRPSSRRQHDQEAMEVMADLVAHLPSDLGRSVQAVLRSLYSSAMWREMHGFGVHGGTAGSTVRWAMETLVADLEAGGGPASRREPSPIATTAEEPT